MIRTYLKEIATTLQTKITESNFKLILGFTSLGKLLLSWQNKTEFNDDDFFDLMIAFFESNSLSKKIFLSYLNIFELSNFEQIQTRFDALLQQNLLDLEHFKSLLDCSYFPKFNIVSQTFIIIYAMKFNLSSPLKLLETIKNIFTKQDYSIKDVLTAFQRLKNININMTNDVLDALGTCQNLHNFITALSELQKQDIRITPFILEQLTVAPEPIYLARIFIFILQTELPFEETIRQIKTEDHKILSQIANKIMTHVNTHDICLTELCKSILLLSSEELHQFKEDINNITDLRKPYILQLHTLVNKRSSPVNFGFESIRFRAVKADGIEREMPRP